MRVTSQMQNTSLINMQSSQTYKKYATKVESDDESKNTADIKHVTNNIVVEKKEDTYILSTIDEEDQKTKFNEVKANTQIGLELSKYFNSDESTDLQNNINQVNQAIKSMTLADYI